MDEFDDDYYHPSPEIYYTQENIPSALRDNDPESIRIHSEFNSQQTLRCSCESACDVNSKCDCLKLNTNYEKRGELLASDNMLTTNNPLFECNSFCSCSKECNNRLVQFGPRKKLKIFNSLEENCDSKGLGIITEEWLPKGTFVCEYAGEIITKLEAAERNVFNYKNNLMNYIICVNEQSRLGKNQTFIDPSKFGNIGRYLNHSCDPNCIILLLRVNCPIPKLCIFTLKDIPAGCELTFDYGSKLKTENMEDSKFEKRIKCLCNSNNCKVWLPYTEYDET